jgi:ABC-type Na+ efflux pump permease subunit
MEWVALVTWVLTAGGGSVMLGLWLRNGGMAQSETPGERIRAGRILSHFALAATGLVIWIIYVATDSEGLAWVAFGLLAVVALLGFSMLATWLGQRSRERPAVAEGPGATRDGTPAEQHFPTPVVALHGVLAATTLVLVLLVAAGVGGS